MLLAMPPVVADGQDDWTTVWLVGGIAGLITLNQLTKRKEKQPRRKTSPRAFDADQWLEENDWTRLIPVPEKPNPEPAWDLSAEDINGICQELLMGRERSSTPPATRPRQLPVNHSISAPQDKTNPSRKGESAVLAKRNQPAISTKTEQPEKKSLSKSVLQKMVFFTLMLLAGFCLWKITPVLTSQKTPVQTIPVDDTAGQPVSLPAVKSASEKQKQPEEKNASLSPQQKGGDV